VLQLVIGKTLQHNAMRCNTLQYMQHAEYFGIHIYVLQLVTGNSTQAPERDVSCTGAMISNTLQRPATHCNTLQRTATHYHALQRTVTHCNALQCTAMHCSTLQHTAMYCNTLQHTGA